MIFRKNQKILFIGDSITDCGRARPYGEGRNALGTGYVSLINAHFEAFKPELNLNVVNMGISGNTSKDLKNRWQTDVLDLNPHWVSIMIGINDVWRQFDNPNRPELHVYADEYRNILDELISTTIKNNISLILMTPFFIEPNRNEPMRKMTDQYSSIVANIAKKYKTIFVDTQAHFDKALKHAHPMIYALDRVHPGLNGHLLIARAFLSAIGM